MLENTTLQNLNSVTRQRATQLARVQAAMLKHQELRRNIEATIREGHSVLIL